MSFGGTGSSSIGASAAASVAPIALEAGAQRLHVGMCVQPMLEIGALVGRQLAVEGEVDVVQR